MYLADWMISICFSCMLKHHALLFLADSFFFALLIWALLLLLQHLFSPSWIWNWISMYGFLSMIHLILMGSQFLNSSSKIRSGAKVANCNNCNFNFVRDFLTTIADVTIGRLWHFVYHFIDRFPRCFHIPLHAKTLPFKYVSLRWMFNDFAALRALLHDLSNQTTKTLQLPFSVSPWSFLQF